MAEVDPLAGRQPFQGFRLRGCHRCFRTEKSLNYRSLERQSGKSVQSHPQFLGRRHSCMVRRERSSNDMAPATSVPNDQRWFHHPEMQARIARAEKDFADGRTTRTETPEEAQDLLDSLKCTRDSGS